MDRRPAVKFCVPLALGITLGWVTGLAVLPLLIITVVLFFLTLAVRRDDAGGVSVRPILIYLLLFSFGALRISADLRMTGSGDLSRYVPTDTVTVSGTVAAVQGRSGRSARYLVECAGITRGDSVVPVSGRFLLHLGSRALESGVADTLATGRTVTVRGAIHPPRPARNPGDMSWEGYFRLQGISGEMRVRNIADLTVGPPDESGFINRYVIPVRRTLSERMLRLVDRAEARFLNGLILGERNEVPGDLKQDFITVGVMHLLAISGQQVVIVAVLLAALLTVLRIPGMARFVLVALALLYYVFLTGNSPSVTRAGIMSVVVLGAGMAQRRQDIYNSLAIAAIIVLLGDPRQLFDPGFLLSFSAVIAIVALYPLIVAVAGPFIARFPTNRLFDLLWKGAAVSLAAGLGTAPIVAYFFGRVSLIGFLANVFIVPLSSLALVLGMVTLAASFVSGWLASVYAAGAGWVASLTFFLVETFAGVPMASVNVRVSLPVLVLFYASVFTGFTLWNRRRWGRLVIAGLILGNILLYAAVFDRSGAQRLRVTFLDVGQGDAAFVELPGGQTMLIDAGPGMFGYNAGEKIILPFLERRGVERIDYLVVSHPHSDHIGGMPALMRSLPVGTVVEGGGVSASSIYREFVRLTDSLGLERLTLRQGEFLPADSPVRVYVLGPDSGTASASANLNESSLTLMVRFGSTIVLFPGDTEDGGEESMTHAFGDFLRSDILKSGHHGSLSSSTDPFLAAVSPSTAVISVGEGNRFGHPSPFVVDRYHGIGAEVLRTDLDGAVVLESDGESWQRVRWR